MKKFITFIATLFIIAGFSPATSSSFAQGDYGQWQAQGDPQQQPQLQRYQGAPPPPAGYQDQSQVAQNNQPADPNAPQPGVARASFIHGDVSSQRGDNNELVPLTLNTPLEAGDRVSTSDNGRAEIQLDYADVLRLNGAATAKIAGLSRQNIQIQIGRGLTTYSELNGAEANAEIDTPNSSVHPTAAGEFRILVTSDDNTQITVRRGGADISTPQGSTHVDAGQVITIQGTDNPQYKIDSAAGRDEWDTWNDQRDSRIENADNYKNTDRYYTGSQDMDGYGSWSEVPDYGQVWTPDQGPDWAPYRDGRWVYEPYYGWTWVAAEPWGWAPYHYGRWFVYGGRWSWWPGPVYGYPGYYPVWSPAYVSFFGWGGGGFGLGVGFGWGRVGWLPIGPCDWYHPWYGGWGARGGVVGFRDGFVDHNGWGPLHGANGRQFANLHDAFTNDRLRGGISSMNGNDFGRGAVPRNQERISGDSFRQASMMTGRMPFNPSHEAFSPTGREANASSFRNMPSNSQRFFSPTHTAVNGTAGGHSFGPVNGGNAAGGNANGMNRGATQDGGRSGWNTFNPPNRGAQNSAGFGNNRGTEAFPGNRNNAPNGGSNSVNNGGWQRFTPPSRETQPQNNNARGYTQQSRPFQQPSQESRGSGSNDRPTLNMRQPVVTPRGGYNQPEQRGYNTPQQQRQYNAPQEQRGYNMPQQQRQYNAPQQQRSGGDFNAPRGGNNEPRGGNSAPRSFSPPSGGNRGGGGNHGGGGHSSGGGGHHR
jgi:hypothetical protein